MRVKNAVRNSFFSVLGQVVLILVGFISQRVLNFYLGKELVGMNGVISNVIAILSVSELGIASAVVYHLYSALSREDEQEIAGLMNLYRKAYCLFAAAITVLGLCVLPVVPKLLKDSSFSTAYVYTIYLLWLVRTVFSYLLSYKRSILVADQKEYIVSIVTLLVNVINYSAVIVIVMLTRRYAAALAVNICVEAVSNIVLARYVDRKYPMLVRYRKNPLNPGLVRKIVDNIKNIFISRLSAKLLLSTDNLIISGFISVGTAGLYTNYSLITNAITNIVVALSTAIQPSVGNMFVEGNAKKDHEVLRQVTFLFFLLAAAASAACFSLMTPFVTDFWLNEKFRLGRDLVAICVVNFCFQTISMPISMMMNVTGLFEKERNLSILSAVVNLVLSLGLVQVWGIVGVLIGTFASYLIQLVYRIRIFYQVFLGQSSRVYIGDILQYYLLSVVETALVYGIFQSFYQSGSLVSFLIMGAVSVLLPTALNLLLYAKSWRLKSIADLARAVLKR